MSTVATTRPLQTVRRRRSFAGVLIALAAAACGSNPDAGAGQCSAADPCACIVPAPGQICVADGVTCSCTNVDEAGAPETGATLDAPGADLSLFAGKWSPIGGNGESNCNGALSPLPPNDAALLTFTPKGPNTLVATSAGASGCTLELVVAGNVATLSNASEECSAPGSGPVAFTTFTLTYSPSGVPSFADAGADVDAEAGLSALADAAPSGEDDADASVSSDDAGADGGAWTEDAGADASPSSEDAGAHDSGSTPDAGADSPPADALDPSQPWLDWQLADDEPTCTTSLHYVLVRAH